MVAKHVNVGKELSQILTLSEGKQLHAIAYIIIYSYF
jgi:hypothetical protein